MKDHYHINDAEFKKLSKSVSVMEMLKAIPEFDPYNTQLPITKIGLMLYIDKYGDFRIAFGMLAHRLIAMAIFNSLNISDKIEILSYFEWEEQDEEENEE